MKKAKKTLCGLLAAALVFALFPVSALAAEIGTGEELVKDTSGESPTGNQVYFGEYNAIPVLWRVVTNDSTNGVTLFCHGYVEPSRQYHHIAVQMDWSNSDICTWLNGTFLNGAFNIAEQAAIGTYGGTETTNGHNNIDISQKIVLPSVEEISGGTDGRGIWDFGLGDRVPPGGVTWWLRSPGGIFTNAAVVSDDGSVSSSGGNAISDYGVRPAFKLDLSSILFTSAAAGGKSGAAGPDLPKAQPPTGAVKLTVYDTANLALGSATAQSVSGRTITFGYAGATASETLSAIVTASDGTVKYYGQLVAAASNTTGSGTTTVIVPDDFSAGDTLSIFVEQINGPNLTDYASALETLSFTEQTAPTGLAGVSCTTSANNDGQITGTTAAMEYSADGGTTWLPCAGTEITGLTPGSYLVRMAASGTGTIASAAVTVTVAAYQQTSFPIIPGNPGSTLTFTNRTLTDSATGVKVTGSFVSGAKLGVTKNALHKEGACAACDEIRERMRADSLIVLYDISATGHKGDGVSVTIPLGNGYDGRLLSVLHCDHGKLEEKILTYADGAVTGAFNSLSPFAVFDGVSVATPDEVVVDAPKTGDNPFAWVGAVLVLCALVAINRKLKMEN